MSNSQWHCPVCKTPHTIALLSCTECGCQLLLLLKIRYEAARLEKAGQHDAAASLWRPRPKGTSHTGKSGP